MQASYLRVKNHAEYQHYDPTKRRPPWIKLYNNLLGGEVGGFENLTEAEQWQLVRIWLVASKSTSLTYDEKGTVVPVISHDEKALRRSIMSLKRIPLEKFIRDGWLIPVAEDELIPPGSASAGASTADSTDASAGASALLDTERQRFRGLEKSKSKTEQIISVLPENESLEELGARLEASAAPFGSEARLFEVLPDMDKGSPKVLRPLMSKLPAASIERCRADVLTRQPRKPTAYAVEILTSMIEKRRSA